MNAGGMSVMWMLEEAIDQMTGRVAEILRDAAPGVYLHGSAALGDFRMGWSDTELLC